MAGNIGTTECRLISLRSSNSSFLGSARAYGHGLRRIAVIAVCRAIMIPMGNKSDLDGATKSRAVMKSAERTPRLSALLPKP